ncbi:TlpA disulfide reductase family protein [Sphingobacterium sp. UT-1RO-CII-1]|uniref:TlpA family protein disulfide reductase n=1 Tax=Sphingobacterium sp. UT-1RO-CII-1 TaxID=2995225 RepID=UPI00227CF8B2|nr:TlpA disulfide reductase family protein [Sphingobacterium sp. UT-1RO-CII-1]MCY4780350.1 TlpA disulfide reductase family protein [Sphingobacterium sp. UT-1RO-CII-1]
MMRFLRKGDCYALEKPIRKRYYLSLNSFQCLLLSLSKIYYQFSCYVQKSRARGTTGEGGRGKNQAVMKPSWSMANVMSFNTLLIHCYYFTHTWRILRPYTKTASARVAGVFGMASRLGRTLVHICSTGVRLLFECCSSAVRVRLEAQSKDCRRAPEGLSNKCRSRLEAQSKDCRRALEGLSNNSRTRLEGLMNRLPRFACHDGKMMNGLHMNRLISRWFHSFYDEARGKVEPMLVKNKRSPQNGLNEADSFLLDKERADDIKRPMAYGLQLIAIFCVLFSFASIVEAKAQELRQGGATEIGEIKPLEIGDTIPEEIWNMPLQVVEYGGKTKEIRLADYRGKVIILDYWATWCAGCILSMPKMHELVEEMPNEVVLLPVTRQEESLITKYLSTTGSKTIQSLGERFYTIVDGASLADLIPHRTIPHIAIINPAGILEQSTKPHLLDKEALLSIAVGKEYYLPDYRGKLDTTILSDTYTDLRAYRPTYYTTISGYMDGFEISNREYTDVISSAKKGNYINYAILKLLQIAAPRKRFDAMRPNRRIMATADSSRLDFYYNREVPFDREQFSISYEYALPVEWSADQIKDKMLDDMALFTGYYAGYIEQEMPSLIIRKQPGAQVSESKTTLKLVQNGELQSNPPKYVGNSPSGANTYFMGAKVDNIVNYLNNQYNEVFPCVIDSTGINYRIDVDLPERLGDIELLKETFQQQGFDVQIENHMMEMFVVADRPIHELDIEVPELVLTRYGYVLKKERGRQ